MKTKILIVTLFLIVISCKKYDKNGREIKDYDELNKASWLLGNWQTVTPEGTLKEIWGIKNDSTFRGQSYFINKKDTIHNEIIELVEDKGKLFYIATVNGENQNLPITFTFIESEENQLRFENPKHDYPNKILYQLKDSLNLDVSISGLQLGKKSAESFKMIRVE